MAVVRLVSFSVKVEVEYVNDLMTFSLALDTYVTQSLLLILCYIATLVSGMLC